MHSNFIYEIKKNYWKNERTAFYLTGKNMKVLYLIRSYIYIYFHIKYFGIFQSTEYDPSFAISKSCGTQTKNVDHPYHFIVV